MGTPALSNAGVTSLLEMQAVNSFGLAGHTGGPDAPATVSLALGVNGEIDIPVVMTFDLPQAEELIANLQRHIAAVRRAEVN